VTTAGAQTGSEEAVDSTSSPIEASLPASDGFHSLGLSTEVLKAVT